jgi:hypothetical protein
VRYQSLDSAARLNLWQRVRDDITRREYESAINGLEVSENEKSFIAAMSAPQRTFDMVSFSIDAYPESEQIAFAEANPALFTVTHLSKITITSGEKEARSVFDSVTGGTTTFEEAARGHSRDQYAERGGDMGTKMAWELLTEVSETADRDKLTALAAGDYSDIIKVPSGWAFFRAEEAPRAAVMDDDSTKQKVMAYINEYERGRMSDWAEAEARDFLSLVDEYGFSEAANQKEIEKRSFGPLPVNYGSMEIFTSLESFSIAELVPGITDENFWITAFTTPLLVPSQPLALGRNILVLFPVEESGPDESSEGFIESYASYWISLLARQSLRTHFLTSDKFEDGFYQAYRRYVSP